MKKLMSRRRRGRNLMILGVLLSLPSLLAVMMTYNHLSTSPSTASSPFLEAWRHTATTAPSITKILGFADYNYRDYALRWYHRLSNLGYTNHFIVAVDQKAIDFWTNISSTSSEQIQWQALPYLPCLGYKYDPRGYRRQIFARRWTFIYQQLQQGYSVLLTDVDNVFSRYLPMSELEDSNVDVYHAYSTSYPTHVFEEMGLTVCGGMSWLRATAKVIRFVGSLVNACKCMPLVLEKQLQDQNTKNNNEKQCRDCSCDDQVVLNELLWKGKHKVIWDRNLSKPKSLDDYQWESMTGVSSKTKHRIQIWDRNIAYRAPMPETCPPNNWVAMPLYVDRGDVVDVWDTLCHRNPKTNV